MGERDRGLRIVLGDQVPHPELVHGVDIREEEGDCNVGDAGLFHGLDGVPGALLVEQSHDVALVVDPLDSLEAVPSTDEGLWLVPVEVVVVLAVDPLDEGNVLEARG